MPSTSRMAIPRTPSNVEMCLLLIRATALGSSASQVGESLRLQEVGLSYLNKTWVHLTRIGDDPAKFAGLMMPRPAAKRTDCVRSTEPYRNPFSNRAKSAKLINMTTTATKVLTDRINRIEVSA